MTRRTGGRILRLLAVVAALALVAAACGDDDDGGDAAGTGDAGGGGEFSGQTIEVAAVWSGAEQEAFETVLAAFEEQTGAEVQFTSTGDDIATVLGNRLEGGEPPDVAVLPQPGLMSDLVGRDALQPIEEIAGEAVDDNYSEDWRTLGSVDDTLYGVWFKAANKSTFWYKPEAFEQAGVETPSTWDDLQSAATTISESGVTPLAIAGGDGWTLTDWFENVYLRVAGAEKYDQLVAHEIPWTDPSVITALTHLSDLWSQSGLIVPGSNSMTFPESVTAVFGGDGAMVFEGDFVSGVITDETDAVPGEDADFFDFPAVDDSEPMVVGGGDVAVLLTDNEPAQELMRFLASPEAAEIWAEIGGFTSPNQNVDPAVYPDDITRRSAEALVAAETFRFDLSDLVPSAFGGTPSQGMWQALQDFLQNPTDVQGTADKLEAAAAAAYK
jgi:ABC-type Fe3+ transport system substrate-binding protein